MTNPPLTLADALPQEIARVTAKRDRWIKMQAEMGPSGASMSLAIAMMQSEIGAAVRACASGDVAEMMAAHENLKGYSDGD